MRNVIALISGAIGGAGLMVSGLTDTKKIQGWLDFSGNWDPTLIFVLSGAVLPMMIAWRFAARRTTAVLGSKMPEFPEKRLDTNLIVGSSLFGIGWGLAGLCPGPALASISYGGTGGLWFLGAMITGMLLAPPMKKRLAATV